MSHVWSTPGCWLKARLGCFAPCALSASPLAIARFGASPLGVFPNWCQTGWCAPRHASQFTQMASPRMANVTMPHRAKARRLNVDESGASSLGDFPVNRSTSIAPRPCEELRRVELQDERHRDQQAHADFQVMQNRLREPEPLIQTSLPCLPSQPGWLDTDNSLSGHRHAATAPISAIPEGPFVTWMANGHCR